MGIPLKTILKDQAAELSCLDAVEVSAIRFYRCDNHVELVFAVQSPLAFSDCREIREELEGLTGSRTMIFQKCSQETINELELEKYLGHFFSEDDRYGILSGSDLQYNEQAHSLTFLFTNDADRRQAESLMQDVSGFLRQIGLVSLQPSTALVERKAPVIESVHVERLPDEPAKKEEKPEKKPYARNNAFLRTKREDWPVINLHDVDNPQDNIQFTGDVFAREDITTKTGRMIQTLSVYDGNDAIMVKRFEGKVFTREMLDAVKEGDRIKVYGSIIFDTFAKDLVCQAVQVEPVEKTTVKDDAPEKRVELHMHTNMSEMDGVCTPEEIVNYVWNTGMEGVCITDHADVQSMVKAYRTAAGLKKKDPERKFKVGLGCEMNMADDSLLIVRNEIDAPIEGTPFVSFDLETTGLSCAFDSIIEFGAVRLKDGVVIDRFQTFIKPPFPIPGYISRKTNITNDMVRNAPSFKDACKDIMAWIGDDILVAHNATFDYNFFNEELRRIGLPPLTNCTIDTLDLARAILPERRAYRLGNIARYYRVSYDEEVAHRADYDAEALAGVFLCLIKDAQKKGVRTIHDLQYKAQGEKAYEKVRRSHVIVLAKNKAGLKRLYQMVTESCTDTLAVMGKSSKEGGEVTAEARIRRSSLQKDRRNILIGSSCMNNEVWEMACNGDDARLARAIAFYDYIELQPLGNYTTFVAAGSVPSMDRVKQVQKRIIAMAQKLGKPVVADSDAHYCRPSQKIFRDVYIMSQGVGGAAHPLYIRDDDLRHKTKNPDQHIRLTNEMLDEFAWLEDEALVHQIVIDNPKKIFNLLEEVQPVPSGTYPPSIEGSDQKLREICYATEKRLYEHNGKIPDIVHNRLEEELENIIRNGFDVHYYIAHLLVKKSNDDGYVVGSRGSVGSSFTATMSGITEVNALPPHYRCPKCNYTEWIQDKECKSGFDLPDKPCPECGTMMRGNGHNIPFQTFLGFNADKVPDIDLNFSNEYQSHAHAFIKQVFGEKHAFRAGTIGTVAEKTAYGYVSGYCEKMGITNMRRCMKDYLAKGCQNVKRTTGQHPGGIIIIPEGYDAEDFTPVQYPANDPNSEWKTTHYDFHDIHDNVLKFDILGHVDPTCMRLMQQIADQKPMTLPMNDPETLSLFYEDTALKADPKVYHKETGALGLPEFGTRTTRKVLEETRPHHFSDLVIISGLSHGTDVWAGNAQVLVQQGHPLSEVIGCRDDIMTYLLGKDLKPIDAFKTMEDVRKGRGLRPDQEENMKAHGVPDWYIESCKKIKYMFPKAHAVAYVMMAIRIAWYKVHEPWNFYIQYFTLRCDAYEIETMSKGIEAVRGRMQDIQSRMQDRYTTNPVSNKEKALFDTLEVCEELYARGYSISNVDLYKSQATVFSVIKPDTRTIIPPFTVIDGLGAGVAESIVEARNQGEFLSKEDIIKRTKLSAAMLKKLEALGAIGDMQESNQMSLF